MSLLCVENLRAFPQKNRQMGKSEEVNYKKNFCQRYFNKDTWDLDVLREVDVLLKNKKGESLLYIEAKFLISNETDYRRALAQTILTNKKQESILSRVALIYQDEKHNDVLELIDCSDNSVMYNNDINWKEEKASSPTCDAIDRINDRIRNKITRYINDEIRDFYKLLKSGQKTAIEITENNFNVVYNQWKNEVLFRQKIDDEQDLINLFLVDMLNGTKYKKSIYSDLSDHTLFGTVKVGEREDESDENLIREGTNLNNYCINYKTDGSIGIIYEGITNTAYYGITDKQKYDSFWRKYQRPPEKHEFLKILERSSTLYSDKYRKDTGGEYTPACFVEKQVEILNQHYNMDEFVVFDPCAGVGNLENQFGKDFKQYCYLSTLEQMDVDTCKIKGFENSLRFDYLKDSSHPKFKYRGTELGINEICQRENRKLMVIMNPPYQKVKGKKNNLAIEFFNKVLTLQPQVIVFYYTMESFFRSEIENYINSGYKIVSHIFSNAKTTFLLSEWAISQVIFDRDKGEKIGNFVNAERYEIEKENFLFKGKYVYDFSRENLFLNLKRKIKEEQTGIILGNVSYLNDVIKIGNGGENRGNHVTTNNVKYCLLSKGLIFNTHHKYFELNSIVYRGRIQDISSELFNDAIMFSLFYIGILFTNKGQKNYIMPFTAEELGCEKNDLNVLFPERNADLFSQQEAELPFDFREFLRQFEFSKDAKDLYNAALQVFKYYHQNESYRNKDWNDSFYDITNAIMGKDATSFSEYEGEKDTRISKVKTTKGTKGFARNTIKYAVNSKYLPIFERFFAARDLLAKKINRQLVDSGLLLWERENIY